MNSHNTPSLDEQCMETAIREAERSAEHGEVPVGAALYRGGELLASAGNMPISEHDPTAHAEIRTLRLAALRLLNYRLPDTTLYVTLEPCIMCAGAILHARVRCVVFGAADPKTGAFISRYHIGRDGLLNHSLEIRSGVHEKRCSQLLTEFFARRRKQTP